MILVRSSYSVSSMDGNDFAALEFIGLVKRFGEHVAVDHIDLVVPAGSFFGLVGPNGAGKTTALSMAVGLLRPDGGTVRIFGHDVWADPVGAKALIGVLPDGLALPDRLTGREILRYLGLLRGLLGLGRKQEPVAEPEVPATKVVRQQPVRQAKSKRSGKR